MDHWTTGMDYWNTGMDWNMPVSMPTIHMHACINGKVLLTMDWLLELHHYHFILQFFVREQCSADCDTLHGYHSRDNSWSHSMSYP